MKNNSLVGQKIERWFIIRKEPSFPPKYMERYFCRCECGKEKVVFGQNLRKGSSKSCGCYSSDKMWKGYGEIPMLYWRRFHRDRQPERRKTWDFDLSIKDAWELFQKQEGKCALSGIELQFLNRTKKHDPKSITASLDRIDNSKGYTKDNVQWVHKDINMMRRKLSVDYFIELCKKVVERNKK